MGKGGAAEIGTGQRHGLELYFSKTRLLEQRRQLAADAAISAPPVLQRLGQANRFRKLWRLGVDCEQSVVGVHRNQ